MLCYVYALTPDRHVQTHESQYALAVGVFVQSSAQFSNTNAPGIKCDPSVKHTDALNSSRKNLSTHAERAQCVAGCAEPFAEYGKASVLKFFKSQQQH